MKRVVGFVFVVALLLVSLASSVEFASSEATLQTIYIKSEGTVEPADVPIQRNGDTYTFTADICGTIVVEKDNLVIDGAGYTLYGTYNGTRTDTWEVGKGPDQAPSNGTLWTIGMDFSVATKPSNLTVKNLNIKNFYIGMYVWTSKNTLTDNAFTDNIIGILLSGDSNNITGNYVAHNDEGVFFGVNTPGNEPLNITLAHNSFVENKVQFSGCFCEDFNTEELMHTWDDGRRGNYWSDYNGTDTNDDGIGDTPYIIDILNQDRYPLMQVFAVPPVSAQKIPTELIILAIVLIAVVCATAIVLGKKRKNSSPQASNYSERKVLLNKKILASILIIVVAGALATVFIAAPWSVAPQQPQEALDFTVNGTNDCLRFLTPTVQTVYIPIKTGAGEQWQLTIDPQMPGKDAWTDVYIYKGYWDQGSNYKCLSEDVYSIMEQIESTNLQIRTNRTFTQTFGASTPQSYTVFFIFPPGGPSTFHVKLDRVG